MQQRGRVSSVFEVSCCDKRRPSCLLYIRMDQGASLQRHVAAVPNKVVVERKGVFKCHFRDA
jgi:hypothetical protein